MTAPAPTQEGGAPTTARAEFRLLGLLSAAVVLLWLAGDGATSALRYERAGVLAGDLWRLLTAHLVHGTGQHLALNLAGLFLIAALFPREYSWKEWLGVGVLSIAAIDAGFVLFEPQLEWYVGFSGVLHGALAAGAVAWWRTEPRWLAVMLTLVLVGKLAWEQRHGALPLSGDLPVIVDAHLYGACGGLLAGIIVQSAKRWPARRRSI